MRNLTTTNSSVENLSKIQGRRKEFLVAILAIMLSFSLILIGCNSGTGNSTDGNDDGANSIPLEDRVAEAYELPLVSEPLSITFATVENADISNSYNENLPAFQELEKRTGIHVNFEAAPADQYNTTMQTRLAAAKDLPDLIRVPDDPIRYATGGVIIPIDDLIGDYAPNIISLFKERPEVKKAMVAPNGRIYTLSAVVDARSMVNLNGIGMRKDWLETLNLKEPDTIDEWYDVLVAFKDGDPNGNGKKDEIPLLAMNINGLYKIAWSYGLHLALSDGWYPDENGDIVYEWIDPKMKEWLQEMNKWYEAGILDPDMDIQNRDKFTAKAIGDVGGVSVSDMTMQFPQWNERMINDFPHARWEGIVPPEGPNGHRMMEQEQPTENIHYAITKDCENPKVLIQWLDYMFASEEGEILMGNFGLEGLSYEMVDGEPQFTDYILKSEFGSGIAQASLGVNGSFPRILMREMIEQRFLQYDGEVAQSNIATKYYVSSFPRVLASKEESDSFTGIMADITTYKDEMIIKFIQGIESLDKFDEYVKSIEGLGIEDAIKIKQDQYDRYMK
ncbi:MAG: extracellular solute-binding protein [Clostridiales bacterium]|nr:extracellular solute-binding protein [Clostridiales bacterium]